MITAYDDAETKRKALENGVKALLTKPIDFGTLRNEIDMRIERAARAYGLRITLRDFMPAVVLLAVLIRVGGAGFER